MSSAPNPFPLAERADVHKSCKSLETLLNILNDYCEAAGAVVVLRKKLVKALREAAGVKATGPIPGSALNSAASIFEILADIDAKFAKLVDKEYDSISAEVKKWFKKLAKEEKAHDDWIGNSNARIKQAGLVYEKKSKKNTRDAEEEHARYINLLSTLGPEMNQEKYNHTLQVTQRHSLTTYNVAACLSRVADAEWIKVCEGVRRIAPTVGQLGEWRVLCEGAWVGPVPQGLPDVDQPQAGTSQQTAPNNDEPERRHPHILADIPKRDTTPTTKAEVQMPLLKPDNDHSQDPPHSPRITSNRPANGTMASNYASSTSSSVPPSSFDPPRPLTDPNTGSVRSLSAFPVPPTHFPIPPLRRPSLTQRLTNPTESPTSSTSQDQSRVPSSTTSNISFPSAPRMTESPIPDEGFEADTPPGGKPDSADLFANNTAAVVSSESQPLDYSPATALSSHEPRDVPRRLSSVHLQPREQYTIGKGNPESSPMEQNTVAIPLSSTLKDIATEGPVVSTRMTGTPRMKPLDRSDTGSSSVVATMKNRITNGTGTAGSRRSNSPPPKDIPRLPLSVVDLASRYQPGDGPVSPFQLRANSPPVSRRMSSPPLDTVTQARMAESAFSTPPTSNQSLKPRAVGTSTSLTPTPDNSAPVRSREQRPTDAAQAALAEKERQLQLREREIEMRARELEQDRARLVGERTSPRDSPRNIQGEPSSPRLTPRERHTSFDNQGGSATRSQQPMPRPQYSYSTTHLVPPSSPYSPSHSQRQSSGAYSQSSSQPPSPQHLQAPSDHAPYCGCDKCSVSKYRTSPRASAADLRPPEKPIVLRPEKPKGWIRRLSMPVGNPFSLDHKRNHSATVGNFSLDGKKNGSSTALRGIQEDGRMGVGRVNYEIGGGVSNRSASSLALGGHDQR